MEQTPMEDRRRHRRFSDRALAGVHVRMTPCPPLYGDPITGLLIDLSAGGMAILLPDLIPKDVFLKMKLTFPGVLTVESVVKVRHIVKQGRGVDFLHGIEFLNPSPDMIKGIEALEKDILSCNDRFKQRLLDVCVPDCSFYSLCTRPQRRHPDDIRHALEIRAHPVNKPPEEEDDSWSKFKSGFLNRLKKAA